MFKTPITRNRLRDHFAYHKWKYMVCALLVLLVWDMVFSMTQYRAPADKRVHLYVQSVALDEDMLVQLMRRAQDEALPEMEEVQAFVILSADLYHSAGNPQIDAYASMQLTTFTMTEMGDVFMLQEDAFRNNAQLGILLPLEGFVADGTIDIGGIDISGGYVWQEEDKQEHLYGIPTDSLYGFWEQSSVDYRGRYLCIMSYTGNLEGAQKLVNWLIENLYMEEKPDWALAEDEGTLTSWEIEGLYYDTMQED